MLIKHFTGIPVGQGILMADGIIIMLMGLVFRSWKIVLLAVLADYIVSVSVDIVQEGLIKERKFLIITNRPDELKRAILFDLGRGVTVIKGEGGYTGEPKDILMVVVSRKQVELLRSLIAQVDKEAFYIVEDVAMTVGKGFRSHEDW
jgi:uncharacterized membrane-anchored protein YitT (DUF2179 family)